MNLHMNFYEIKVACNYICSIDLIIDMYFFPSNKITNWKTNIIPEFI